MAARLVAADASPLIGLAAAGASDLLRKLHGLAVTGLTGVLLAAKSARLASSTPSILRASGNEQFQIVERNRRRCPRASGRGWLAQYDSPAAVLKDLPPLARPDDRHILRPAHRRDGSNHR